MLTLNNRYEKIKIHRKPDYQAIKDHDSGKSVEIICRELNITRGTFYNWKKKYSGMEVSQLKMLKEPQEENLRLKRMYADLSLNHRILKDVIEKKL